ncbi:hypothetical protein [Streptomyces sp. NPDC087270]|uniref:hypothetical protein n=1 Tax=Streptomyces sp. NPDC087270 TaxID=3365774 RepID=UPI0037F9699A
MSVDQPPPPAGGRNPFGAPGYHRPEAPDRFVPPPGAGERNHLGLGLAVGVLVAVVAAFAYGGLLWGLTDRHGSSVEFHFGAFVMAALVGITVGEVGGRVVALPFAAALLTAGAVIFGSLFGAALIAGDTAAGLGHSLSVTDVFFHHFGSLWRAWTHDFGLGRLSTLCCSALTAYGLARYFGDR